MSWTDIVQAAASVGALLAAVFGFTYVARQIALVQRSMLTQANAVLSDQSLAIMSFIAEHPQTYDYFYHNKPLAPDDPHRVMVLCVSEMIANYCDMTLAMLPDLPPAIAERWQRFVADATTCSPALREHLATHRLWYSDALLALV